MIEEIERKPCELELKDLSESKGIVSFYFSPFGIPDVDKDEATPTTFDKTMKENKGRIKHFRNHDKKEVPGTIVELGKDEKGAFVRSQLAVKTVVGLDTFEQYKAGIITEHSYGFVAIRAEKKSTGGRILKEVKMFEASSLTHWGASQYTPMMSMKSLEEASDYIEKLNKLLTTGNISDDLGARLEIEVKSLYDNLMTKVAEMKKKKQSEGIDFAFLVDNLKK